ncbi:hypothetical protein VA7868_02226 [Vibrio aerogenes CECT 7868]|uniref:Uncharacterized protein n=1 Tax=Vibrio aerogenes CECT 7868 TaxID=1216006 RepID=A0A1M5Z2N2_9VIBR|nr:hypothetical protein [Vibrio aerogenes]SHI18510.1 hypothetical protein VA7868_02226 [Vibrio aerogenes CECT 7868]
MKETMIHGTVPVKAAGFVTLLVVIAMMTIAVALIRQPYLRIQQQSAEVSHEIHRAQSFWRAEGVLECLWWQVVKYHGLITDRQSCLETGETLTISGQRVRSIRVQNQDVTLEQQYRLPLPTSVGVMKTSARLILTQPARFMPDPGEKVTDNLWSCVVLRYRLSFQAPSVTTYHPSSLAQKPYRDFPDSGGQLCQESHRTLAMNASNTRLDFLHDPAIAPFRDLFGLPRTEWRKVAQKSHHLPVAYPAVWYAHCARQIIHEIQQGHLIVWVEGGCILSDEDIFLINQAIRMKFAEDGIILVVRDGAIGVSSDRSFRGAVIQLLTPSHQSEKFSGWTVSPLYQALLPVISRYDIPIDQLSYFQSGRFFPLGGLYLATPGRYAVINGALDTRYDRDLILRASDLIKPVAWVPGSWYVE